MAVVRIVWSCLGKRRLFLCPAELFWEIPAVKQKEGRKHETGKKTAGWGSGVCHAGAHRVRKSDNGVRLI